MSARSSRGSPPLREARSSRGWITVDGVRERSEEASERAPVALLLDRVPAASAAFDFPDLRQRRGLFAERVERVGEEGPARFTHAAEGGDLLAEVFGVEGGRELLRDARRDLARGDRCLRGLSQSSPFGFAASRAHGRA